MSDADGTRICPRCGARIAAAEAVRCDRCSSPLDAPAPAADDETLPAGGPQAGAVGNAGPDARVGTRVGRYRLTGRLGAGGMGVVYRAVDEQLRRTVALKFLSERLAGDAAARARFLREARAASALDHPNIGAIHDVGEEGGQPWLAIAYYEGVTLADRVRGGPLPVVEAVRVARQIALGLGAAHQAGIVHRDIKPANIVLTRDGTAKVLDFGLAKQSLAAHDSIDPGGLSDSDDSAALSRAGAVMGTLAYMSPEQLSGDPVDHRSDLWSLGVTTYEMLAGERPFHGTSGVAVGGRILSGEPSPLSSRRPEVPASLERLVERLLRKRPAERPASAAEVVAVLDGVLAELGGGSGSDAAGPSLSTVRPRSSSRWVGLVLLAVALLGGGVVLLGRRRQAGTLPVGPDAPRRTVAVLGFKDLSARPDAAWISTALAEMLGTELSAGAGLRAIPGENVARMKGELGLGDTDTLARDTLARVARNLGSDLVLVGAYLPAGSGTSARLRLDLRVQRTSDGEVVAALSETGSSGELPELASRAAAHLRAALGLASLSAEQASSVRRAQPISPVAERAYAEGLAHLRLGDAAAARERFREGVAAEPDHPLLHSALAEALFLLGDDGEALTAARRAFELSSRLLPEDRLLIEARLRRVSREYNRVVDVYRQLVAAHPDDLDLGLELALAQDVAGDQEGALATLASLRRLPVPLRDDPRIDIAEARALQTDEALRVQLARRGADKARAAGATLLLGHARRVEARAHLRLGESAAALSAASEALTLFEQARLPWAAADASLLIAEVAEQRGDAAAARAALEQRLARARAMGSRAAAIDSELRLAGLLARQGRFAEAESGLAAVRRLVGDRRGAEDAQWLAHLARWQAFVEERHGHLDRAEAACGDAFVRYHAMGAAQPVSGRPATAMVLARVRHQQGRLGDARLRLEEALAWAETHAPEWLPAGRRTLASIALDEGRLDEAVRLVRLAIAAEQASAPLDRAESALLLAEIQRRTGDEAGSRSTLARAALLSRSPADGGSASGFVDARLRVGTGLARLGALLDPAARDASLGALPALVEEADRLGLLGEALRARLALGELSLQVRPAEGRARLATVRNDAHREGYGAIVRAASRLLDPDGAADPFETGEPADLGAPSPALPTVDAAPPLDAAP